MFKKLLLSFVLIVGALLSIALIRTLMHSAPEPTVNVGLTADIDGEAATNNLAASIRFKTISHQDKEKFSPQEFEGFIKWAADTYPEFHSAMQLEMLEYTLLFKWEGSDNSLAPILLTAHYDVVPVIPGTESIWEEEPFAGVISNNRIWGRGALDDKSGVVGMMEAATYLIQNNFQPTRTVYFSFGHDEEIGGGGAAQVTEKLKQEGVQLQWSLDEGSFVNRGFFPGVDKLVAPINVAEKGIMNLLIVAKAKGGHSSTPPKKTAVTILADALIKLENEPLPGSLEGLSAVMFDEVSKHMPFGYRFLFANRWLFGGLLDSQMSSTPVINAMIRTTTAPTMLSGSIKSNVLPIEATALINFRLHPRDSIESVTEHVRRVVGSEQVEVRTLGGMEASGVSSWESPGYEIISSSLSKVYGEVVSVPGIMIAASDTRHYSKVADNSFRFNPFSIVPEDMTGFHGTNESIAVDSFIAGIKTYVDIINEGSSN
ncbi:M20 family peptidase [Gammaproteobacteria bacterium]|nr:M20 family peptidase [Gammaproteobacteria bacterium]MDB9837840.1 M20 family peptidase [Gammaproteobacteria bacterium]MDB9854828.1 M20 family peptidase [Gammaproteobacteria bacterium]MDC1164755.1 M20 family peptidase [Gammaproteobacteria bacterium]MDC1484651.1 M20 family peptidase [Gammaproteobacteria bacterium]